MSLLFLYAFGVPICHWYSYVVGVPMSLVFMYVCKSELPLVSEALTRDDDMCDYLDLPLFLGHLTKDDDDSCKQRLAVMSEQDVMGSYYALNLTCISVMFV